MTAMFNNDVTTKVPNSPFELINKATGFCLVKMYNRCLEIRWTTGDRLLIDQRNKCLGTQGKSVGSEISLYDCDENSELQKWECKNETVLALKGQELYIELTADNTAILSKTIGPNNHLTISGTSSGACTRTYKELYTIGGNANGRPCMFPFLYKNRWYSQCTTFDSSQKRLWCAIETRYEHELWGFCPTNSKEHWNKNPITGAYYQLNTQAALTWPQAEASCKQQAASLLSITDPHNQAYVTGHPLPNPGYNCAIVDGAVQFFWQSSLCSKKLGYICYSEGPMGPPTQAVETGFCSSPWIPYNGHCFHLQQTQKTWSDAQRACLSEGGNLVSIRNLEDQSFVISQLGYASTNELWIGLNDRKTEGLFEWSDHSTVSFTSWEFGNPAVFTDLEDCVLIRGENGDWADRVCEEKHGFICMKISASQPTEDEVEQNVGCKSGWRRHGSYCYYVGTETKTFDEAKEYCKSSDSYLADVSNRMDNAFLVSLVGMRPEKYFWLGLSNQNNIDDFVWTNTDSVKYTHWNTEMPGHQQGCVAMTTGVFAGLWDVLPCTNKEKYICKQLAEGVVVTPAPPTAKPTVCADGWSLLGSRNYCFKLFTGSSTKEKTWYEARDYCRAIGGDLLSIHSAIEQELIPERYTTVWIGLSAPNPITGYVWSDGSPLQFQHWENGEPNNKNNVESCTEFKIHFRRDTGGSWNDVHCETYHGWFCQIRADKTPNPPPDPVAPEYNTTSDGWLEWNGNQYYFNINSIPMEDARYFCKQRHSDLVTINSEAESVFLWKQISRKSWREYYWIGLNVDLDGTYECTNMINMMLHIPRKGIMTPKKTTLDLYNTITLPYFAVNDYSLPMLHQKECAVMNTNSKIGIGKWISKSCNDTNGYICIKNVDPSIPDAPEPTSYNNYVQIFNDSIKVVTQKMTWGGAKKHCEGDGAKLASLRNVWTQNYVELMALDLQAPLWIGLNKKETGGYFKYIDGWYVSSFSWGIQEPSRDRPCVYVDVDGKYKTALCNETMTSVCMKSTEHGTLVSIEEPQEQEFIHRNLQTFKDSISSFWIGLYKTHTGRWLWLDKKEMSYTNWAQDQPHDLDYGEIETADGTWNAARMWYNKAYICKIPKALKQETSPTPGNVIEESHVHTKTSLIVLLVIIGIAVGAVTAIFLFKKSGRRLTIPKKTTFDNPLFFSNEQSEPTLVATNKLVVNAEEENPESVKPV
ncbi:hypothetical protein PAMP_005094 [Pampus punctatissimus]